MGGQVQGRAICAALPGAGLGRWTQAPKGWGTEGKIHACQSHLEAGHWPG